MCSNSELLQQHDLQDEGTITRKLLLYCQRHCYYTQKVVMALHEKNLPFETHFIDIVKKAQYEQWYLQLNPKGEVPVLQDTGKIIPDSARIIDYLEDNFSNGDTPRLIPMDQGPEIRQRVTHFRHIIDQLPAAVITFGSFFHSELVGRRKLPFIAPVRRILSNAQINNSKNLRELAKKNPEFQEVLLQKAAFQENNNAIIVNKDEYEKCLKQVDEVLTEVEEELSKHVEDKEDWWLCSNRFTVADIALTILLERLNQLGLESRFWKNEKRVHVAKYYERVKQRDSYKKTIPSMLVHMKVLFITQRPLFIGIGLATAVAIIVGGVFLVKKLLT